MMVSVVELVMIQRGNDKQHSDASLFSNRCPGHINANPSECQGAGGNEKGREASVQERDDSTQACQR